MNCKKCGREIKTEPTTSVNYVVGRCTNPDCKMFNMQQIFKVAGKKAKK
jgi:hypothetical protein